MSEIFSDMDPNNYQQIKLQLSDDILWGYRDVASVHELHNNPGYVAHRVQDRLLNLFAENNLTFLYSRVAAQNFHIHNTNPDNEGIVYICTSCSGNSRHQ